MAKLEVFYDYICPFCYDAHGILFHVLEKVRGIDEIIWCPAETHPRPEPVRPHTDLAIMGFYYAKDKKVDLLEYNKLLYKAAIDDRVDLDNAEALSDYVSQLIPKKEFKEAVTGGKYKSALAKGNHYAYTLNGVFAFPAYRINGKKLDAVLNVGVTKKQLENFLILSK